MAVAKKSSARSIFGLFADGAAAAREWCPGERERETPKYDVIYREHLRNHLTFVFDGKRPFFGFKTGFT